MNNTTNKRNTNIGGIEYATKFAANAKPYEIFMNKSVTPNELYYKNGNGVVSPISSPTDLTTIQNDLNALETTVNALPAAPTTTVVNISPTETTYDDGRPLVASGILAMGTTPIELLPAPGANKYYEFHKIILEFEPGLTPYATSTGLSYLGAPFPYMSGQIYKSFKNVNIAYTGVNYADTVSGNAFSPAFKLNQKLYLTTLDGLDPTDGDGTLRAIITYTVKTFGA